MNPMISRHIVISFVVAFILFILVRANQDDNQMEHPGVHTSLQSHTFYRSFNSDQSFSPYYHNSLSNSNLNRHDILQTKVKGYREQTYWGQEHPTQERTRYFSDEEFERFIYEKVELKDVDVYWGAEY